ncbi:DUF4212 domain-containing protein [Halorubellus salinus]|uniref:DUF4212 domain-containing protein n=1 Tax=Halorubellus salinus TaxID=755309 RepID=UPI001D062339|nr:DUF4212 domain-containing protein [Halorubellus salinus]
MRDTDSQRESTSARDPTTTDASTEDEDEAVTETPTEGGDGTATGTPTEHPHEAAAPHPRTDGGTVTADATSRDRGEDVDYLEREVNIFKPSTPFMRDHLRVVWAMFAAWAVVVFGPVTATALAPDAMTSVTVIGFPLHYVTTAIGAPTGALVLSFVYARKRDQLDERYGIDHGDDAGAPSDDAAKEPTAADGGVEQ